MFVKKTMIIVVCLFTFVLVAGDIHAKSLDDILSSSSIKGEDAKRVKDLYGSLVSFGVNEDELLLIVGHAINSDVETNKLMRLLVLISKTALADIPTKALINKVLEGFAKGAVVDVVIKEAESKVLNLKNAKSVLNHLMLKGYKTKQPDMAINVISIYLTRGWEPSGLKREIESEGLSKKEFYELSLFLKENNK